MSQRCEICGKGPVFGSKISHAHNVSGRRWNPNLQHVKVKVGGKAKKMYVCTRCLKSGTVEKAL
jgi:large subunit ribosomal protein L28